MLEVILTGPESSGKTTLAKALSLHYGVPWVPEYARYYLQELPGGKYTEADLLEIARGQLQWRLLYSRKQPYLLICDTGMLVVKIWSEVRFGRCEPWIEQQLDAEREALHLLCTPDIPWEPDPLRENPTDRPALFQWYQDWLEAQRYSYHVIAGEDTGQRMQQAIAAIEKHLGV